MQALPSSLWLDLLGKPFAAGARGPDAYDCVGLLVEIMRRRCIELPPWGSHVRELDGALAWWEPVGDPQPGDGILFVSDDPPWHVGVVTGGGYMIHAHPSCGVARERYNSFPWLNQIRGFYRANGKRTESLPD